MQIWAFARQELRLTDAEFWNYTWAEIDALATAWRKRERRQDVRNALIRHTMACLWSKDPPKFEDLLPPDEDAPEITETEDERMTRKLDLVMAQFGGAMPADRPNPQEEPEEDEFTKKMWRLMGVSD